MVMRSGKQDGQKVTFIKNNIFHDAFFLKALVLNGACSAECEPADGGKKYSVGHLGDFMDGHGANLLSSRTERRYQVPPSSSLR